MNSFVCPAPKIVLDHPNFQHNKLDLKQSIKLITWNINKINCNKKWQFEFKEICTNYQPDFILLQEFYWIQYFNLRSCFIDIGWEFAPNLKITKTGAYSGVLTASKVKPSSRTVLFTDGHEPMTKTPKLSLIHKYPIAGYQHPLWVINIHGINFVTTEQFKAQLDQLKIILSTHVGLLLLAGDFNTWNLQRMNLLKSMLEDLHLNFVGFTPAHQRKIKRFLLSPPLDHICYPQCSLNVKRALVLSEFQSSDHVPLFAEFSYGRKENITNPITELNPD